MEGGADDGLGAAQDDKYVDFLWPSPEGVDELAKPAWWSVGRVDDALDVHWTAERSHDVVHVGQVGIV